VSEALNPELVMQLRVQGAPMIARDVRRFDLVHPEGASLPSFTPGAHLLIQAPNAMTRRYSLCNAPGDADRYSIAVKREAAGRGGSASMVDAVDDGDLLHVSTPRNDFELKEGAPGAQAEAKRLVAQVAGESADDYLIDHTSRLIARMRAAFEGREGVAAFLEKRKPAWRR